MYVYVYTVGRTWIGAFYRPVKKPVSLRVDADVLDWFQRQGSGYQTRMNAVLRAYVEEHRSRG
ncbi:hypothetical protein DYQ86_11185 [Acidobacteria bacterium AB60]|nr:hypothetical protein DYQ86_11185 [Acidobacteria bacterium AB60]